MSARATRLGAAAIVAACVAMPTAARADVIEGTVTTVLTGRSDPRDGVIYSVVPVYQLLNFTLRDVNLPGNDKIVSDLRLEVSAWFGGLLGEPYGGQRFTGDVNLAFAEAKFFRRKIELRLGRQMVVGGVARFSHIDGATLTFNVWRGLGLSVFGGVPVIPRFGLKVGDATAGTRLFYRVGYRTEVGASFVHLHDHGRAARQDIGIDARTQPHRAISLSGLVVFSLLEKQLAEADFGVTLQPWRFLTARVDYRHDVPSLWIPRSSIFAVFSDTTRDEVGGEVEIRWPRYLASRTDYHTVIDDNGVGHRAGTRLTITPTNDGRTQIGIEGRMLKRVGRGYFEGRAFAFHKILPTLLVSVDVDAYKFDQALNGRDYSVTGTASLAWEFARGFRAAASGAVIVSPFVDNGYDFMVKLAYMPVARFREKR